MTSIWEQWGIQLGIGRRHERKAWEGSPDSFIEARIRDYFASHLDAVKWTATKLAGIDPEAAVDEAVALLIAGFKAGLRQP